MKTAATVTAGAGELRLAAIDLDDTLLGRDKSISRENRRAVAQLAAAGIEVILASGRHHASIATFARELPGVRWIVSAQGGEVSDVARSHVLGRTYLSAEEVATVAPVRHQHALPALFYTRDEILTDMPAMEPLDQYHREGLVDLMPRRVLPRELAAVPIQKIVCVGMEERIERLVASPEVRSMPLQKVRTHRKLFEFMPRGVTKATGLALLARHLGLRAAHVVAFGDAENDIPMFDWAGLSFAMPHGWPEAKRRAHHVAPVGPADAALARAVAQMLEG